MKSPGEANQQRKPTLPRNFLRVGVSTGGSSLLLCDSADNVCFDSEGSFHASNKKTPMPKEAKIGRDAVVGVLLNLNTRGPNAFTISLFKEGVRVTPPQEL